MSYANTALLLPMSGVNGGNFSLSVPASAEFSDIDGYSVIALDDAAGTDYNDLVFGRVGTV